MTDRIFLSAKELADMISTSERTVRRWIACDEIPSVRIGGKRLIHIEVVAKRLGLKPTDLEN
jgi:excisionase family DNA binding protein